MKQFAKVVLLLLLEILVRLIPFITFFMSYYAFFYYHIRIKKDVGVVASLGLQFWAGVVFTSVLTMLGILVSMAMRKKLKFD